MSESDADVGSPASDASGPTFPVENKYYSEKDKSEVLAMPEVEREALLAERAQVLERKQQDTILKRLYKGYKDKGKSDAKLQKKRKASAADLEDGERKSSRQRTLVGGRKVGETNSAMEAYKATREQKGVLAEQRKIDAADRKAGRGRRKSPRDSDADADGDSEPEWDDTKPKQPQSSPFDEPAELADYNRVLIGRMNFAMVCYTPGFEQAVKDCYVRVNMGGNPATGDGDYRMAKIVGIDEGRPYAVEGNKGKKFITRQYVRCTIGKKEREYPFIFCSQTRIVERELAQYKAQVTNDGQLLPKKKILVAKIDAINGLINHQWTTDELNEKFRKNGMDEMKNNSIERQQLLVKRKRAEGNGEDEVVEQIDKRLQELRPPKLAFGTTLFDPIDSTPKGPTQQERLAELNRQNRKADSRDIRKAQLLERRRKAELRAAVERGEANPDPLARVTTLPKTHWDAAEGWGRKNSPRNSLGPESQPGSRAATPISRAGTPRLDEVKKEAASTPKRSPPKKGGTDWSKFDPFEAMNRSAPGAGMDENGERKSVFKRKMCDDEILANMDFGLDLDIEVT